MTIAESQLLLTEMIKLFQRGKKEDALQLLKKIPVDLPLAVQILSTFGINSLIHLDQQGYNLFKIEEALGKNWQSLTQEQIVSMIKSKDLLKTYKTFRD